MPYAELARRLSRGEAAVANRRRDKPIPAVGRRKEWRPQEDKLLVTRTDKEVARLLRRHLGSVQSRRTRLKIPAYRSSLG